MYMLEHLVVQKKNTNEVNYMAVIKGKRETQNDQGGTYSRDLRYIVMIEPKHKEKNFFLDSDPVLSELRFYQLQTLYSKTLIDIVAPIYEQYSGQNALEWYRWGAAKLDEFYDIIKNGDWFN